MGFSLALLFASAVVASSSGFAIQNSYPDCPPPEIINPCTCSTDDYEEEVTATCRHISNAAVIQNIISNNPGMYFDVVNIDHCSLDYVPSSILENATYKMLNVSSSDLVSLFDVAPVKKSGIIILLMDVKILRGIQWELFSNISLDVLSTLNVEVKTFGNSFKEHMPQEVKILEFVFSKTESITDQAFQRLVNLELLAITGGSLKKLSRDMFPRPWGIQSLRFNRQKLAALPKDFFEDLPNLREVHLENNFFTTLPEEVFDKKSALYYLSDNPINCICGVKWIPTANIQMSLDFIGTCAEPESMKGRKLGLLKEEDFRYCQ